MNHDRIAAERPLAFCDVEGAEPPRMIEDAAEQSLLNALQLGREELKGFLAQQLGNARGKVGYVCCYLGYT